MPLIDDFCGSTGSASSATEELPPETVPFPLSPWSVGSDILALRQPVDCYPQSPFLNQAGILETVPGK